MEIYMNTMPVEKMRYPTPGDYLYHTGIDLFRFMIAKMKDTDHEALIFEHEFREAYLCWKAGIKEEDISSFDKMFEEERASGLHGINDEPGDDKRAPYYEQHQKATRAEQQFCDDLGISWGNYSQAVEDLFK